ncbi:hypothetical protein C4B38_000245 [Diabrotica virgifera virgifera]|uniref:Cytochrome P450 6k1-like n=1 Tax=Diabrotica virgifera virgifera TaxID=50390 RepID=A0A6P7GG40_DIAVI|nr:hypothetical protein C4B38_000245 [Diabrotica virgifera virgifera]
MLVTSSIILDLVLILLVGIYFLFRYTSKKHKYFEKIGVYTPKIQPIFGHFLDIVLLRTTLAEWLKYYYDRVDKPFFGLYVFDDPYFVIKDADIVKTILVKDFNSFVDRNIAAPDFTPLTKNMMFLQKSPAWKNDRAKMTVVFSSGKLKGMFPLIKKSVRDMTNFLQKNRKVMEAKELAAKFSTDVISQCAFGIDSHCFDERPSLFRSYGRQCFEFSLRNAFAQTIYFFKPSWVERMKLEFMPKDAMTYFAEAFTKTMKSRTNNSTFNDLIDILNDLKEKKELSQEDDVVLSAISIQFFLAGYETTSSAISFTLYELAKHPHIQEKLREEIKSVLKKYGDITYEAIQEMSFLEMCLLETLRMYPVLPFLERKCNSDYTIPNTNVVIENGTCVLFPIYGLQTDESIFPNPLTYTPERFNDNYYNLRGSYFLPFGEGPRGCIGERFGKISAKMAIITALLNSNVTLCKQSPNPVRFEPKSFLLQSTVGLPLMFNPI